MQKAYFRFYEELNDFLPPEKQKTKFPQQFKGRVSVKDLIESLGVPHTQIDLILVNSSSVNFSYHVKDGDEISVYPVFESLDITNVQHLRAKPLRIPKFILDVHLGKLARYMRLCGFDVYYKSELKDDELIEISLQESRTILTKDIGILKRNIVTHGYWLRSSAPKEQLKEVLHRFDLKDQIREFSRCLECNSLVKQVSKEKIFYKLQEKTKKYFDEFFECVNCGRVYWKGSHYHNMRKLLDQIISPKLGE